MNSRRSLTFRPKVVIVSARTVLETLVGPLKLFVHLCFDYFFWYSSSISSFPTTSSVLCHRYFLRVALSSFIDVSSLGLCSIPFRYRLL